MKHPLPSESAALVFSDWSSLIIISPAAFATAPLASREQTVKLRVLLRRQPCAYDGNRARRFLQLAARAREQKMPTSFNRLNGRNHG